MWFLVIFLLLSFLLACDNWHAASRRSQILEDRLEAKKDIEDEYRMLGIEARHMRIAIRQMDIEIGRLQGKGAAPMKSFDKVMVKDLIFLCHPDKHNGSDRAKRITQELLSMRQ